MIYDMTVDNLGEYIKNKRLDKHLTREKLAGILSISASHLNAIERGLRIPSRDLMRSIAKELDIEIEVLYERLEGDGTTELPKVEPTQLKSRIPDLPPDLPLEPELEAVLNDPRLGKIFYSKQYLARLSNAELRQLALDALNTLKEIEDYEASEQ